MIKEASEIMEIATSDCHTDERTEDNVILAIRTNVTLKCNQIVIIDITEE